MLLEKDPQHCFKQFICSGIETYREYNECDNIAYCDKQ